MRPVRAFVRTVLVLLGLGVVLAAVMADVGTGEVPRVLMALTGILLVEAAGWKRANPVLPSTRRHDELREEVTDFLDLVRNLDRAKARALRTGHPVDEAACRDIAGTMHESVDRMEQVAGRVRPRPRSLAHR